MKGIGLVEKELKDNKKEQQQVSQNLQLLLNQNIPKEYSYITTFLWENQYFFGGKQMEKQLKDEINKALENIEDIWILHQIYHFAVNMSKDDLSK